MSLTVDPTHGEPYGFEVVKGMLSRLVCEEILAGITYPVLPFIGDVRVVVDAGANCGAATVYFAQHYRDAVVHAVEPATEPLAVLRHNVRGLSNVVVHPIGLHSRDEEVTLFLGKESTIVNSIVQNDWHDASETISLRSALNWARDEGIDRIDVLKVDVERSEYEVLSSLGPFLPEVKVVYLEYELRETRRAIERLLDPTHDLYFGRMSLDLGECIYLRRDLADADGVKEALWRVIAAESAKAARRADTSEG